MGKTVFETAAFSRSATLPKTRLRNKAIDKADKRKRSFERFFNENSLGHDRIMATREFCLTRRLAWYQLAERWGFEPQIRFWRIHDFQSCSLSQTRTSLQSVLLHVR